MPLFRKQIFNGRLIKLYLTRQRFPNGYVADLEVVKHPGAVLIVPILPGGKVVLIRQYRPVIKSFIWELPAGTLHKGENPLSCAKRELVEEIGYEGRLWKKIGFIYPAPGYTTEKIAIYRASLLRKVESSAQEDEIIAPRIFSRAAVRRLLKSGKIVDAKTIAALALLRLV